jgi:hypothetical protein
MNSLAMAESTSYILGKPTKIRIANSGDFPAFIQGEHLHLGYLSND